MFVYDIRRILRDTTYNFRYVTTHYIRIYEGPTKP